MKRRYKAFGPAKLAFGIFAYVLFVQMSVQIEYRTAGFTSIYGGMFWVACVFTVIASILIAYVKNYGTLYFFETMVAMSCYKLSGLIPFMPADGGRVAKCVMAGAILSVVATAVVEIIGAEDGFKRVKRKIKRLQRRD